MELLHAFDFDDVRTGAADTGAHGVEKVGQVDHVGLLGCVFNDSSALGQDCGNHDVHRRAHRLHIQIDAVAHQTLLGGGNDLAADGLDGAAQASKPLICWSMGREPKSQPPGMATSARPKRPNSAPMR